MGTSVKPEDVSPPLRYLHREDDAGDDQGEGRQPRLSARGRRKANTQAQKDSGRYTHLKDEDLDLVTSLLCGTLALKDVPRVKSKVIKLFISSTFTDMEVERNALAEKVFPKLRQYCRDKYGVDFQAVDMRWGVSPDARDDHSATKLCLAELTHCRECSIGPNFALLLGQKYGTCPLPADICRFEFDPLRMHLEQTGNDVKLLDQCYLQDTNVTPSVYRLQNISTIEETTDIKWLEVEPRLKKLIEDGAKMAVDASDMKADDMRKLLASVTEHEAFAGLLEVRQGRERADNCVLFERRIDGLTADVAHPLAPRFCDVQSSSGTSGTSGSSSSSGQQQLNQPALDKLDKLKEMSKNHLPRFNYCYSKVDWTTNGIDPSFQGHREHLDRVGQHFYRTTKALVDRNMDHFDQLASDALYHEVVAHWCMADARCHCFVGREVPLMTVRQYLTEESSQPLVIHGESGVGKTSFLAKVASMVRDWTSSLVNPVRASVVLRFSGTTPLCSAVQPLLHSICHQVAFLAGRPRSEVPEDYKSLKLYFIDVLQHGEVPGMLVVVLDSLDQLSASNGAHKLDWLPARLASNVKVIVSSLPKHHGLMGRLRSKVGDESLLPLTPLPATDAERIMKVLLEAGQRWVTLAQWRVVREAFRHCTLPLFVTLALQEAARWRSYDDIPLTALKHTMEASIEQLFERLEAKHGKVFVSRALAYVTAAPGGLSESELEDVLSLDEEVLSSVFTFWLPPIRRIPPSLLPRLYVDVASFLVERGADDVTVRAWYHQQFEDAATARYLKDDEEIEQVHSTLADYYLGTWSGTAEKPFTLNEGLMKRMKTSKPNGKACRFVPDMPLIFHSESQDSERFNLRKMSQLPYSLLLSGQYDKLRRHCFCNYDWLHAKLRATSVQQVLADFLPFDDRETDLVADVLRMSGSTLSQDPDHLALEISGRLLPHIARYPAVRALVRQCDLAAQTCCPLVPLAQLYAAPGGPLQYECDLAAKSAVDVDVFSSPDGILLTAKSYYSTCLKVWELSQGEPRQDMHLPKGSVHPSRDGHYLAILRDNRHVSVYKTDSGELHGHVEYDYGEVGTVATGKRYMAICLERVLGLVVVDLESSRLLHRFNLDANAVAVSPCEELLCFASGRLVHFYSLPNMERKCVGQACDDVQQICFTDRSTKPNERKCFLLSKTKMLKSISFDIRSRRPTPKTRDILQDLGMREFSLSHNENLILVRCLRCLYLVDAHREKCIHRLQEAPNSVFTQTMTDFEGAGFTPDDSLVVAARYTYLFVWNASSGQPVRVLQAALSPIEKIFMSPATNKAVTLLRNNVIQVWNLDNIDADILHANEIFKGAVKTLAVSSTTGIVACHGGVQGQAEVKLVDTSTGRVAGILQQTPYVELVTSVTMSSSGRYVLTFNTWAPRGESVDREIFDWPMLRNIVLWDVHTCQDLVSQTNTRFAIFDKHGASLGIVICMYYSKIDWTYNSYTFSFRHLDSEVGGLRESSYFESFEFPENSEFVGAPLILYDRPHLLLALIAVLQTCTKTGKPGMEKRKSETMVFIQFLRGGGDDINNNTNINKNTLNYEKISLPEPIFLRLPDLLKFPEEGDRIASVKLMQDNHLQIEYVKGVHESFKYSGHGLVVPPDLEKGSVLYDVVKRVVVKNTMRILDPSSDLTHMLTSPNIHVDQNLQVFDVATMRLQCRVAADWCPGKVRLALEGRYLLGLSRDCRFLQVARTSDGVIKGSVLIHGKATHLEVAEDGRTIAVGTSDGRVMLLSLVLELSDPYTELIKHFSSRSPPPPPTLDAVEGAPNSQEGGLLMDRDAQVTRGTTPEQNRMSSKIRSDVYMAARKRPGFRSIVKATTLAQKFQQSRSQACCIQ